MQQNIKQVLQCKTCTTVAALISILFQLAANDGVPSRTGRYAVIGCKLKQNANEGCNSCATVVQVLQDLFYVLLHVLFYL